MPIARSRAERAGAVERQCQRPRAKAVGPRRPGQPRQPRHPGRGEDSYPRIGLGEPAEIVVHSAKPVDEAGQVAFVGEQPQLDVGHESVAVARERDAAQRQALVHRRAHAEDAVPKRVPGGAVDDRHEHVPAGTIRNAGGIAQRVVDQRGRRAAGRAGAPAPTDRRSDGCAGWRRRRAGRRRPAAPAPRAPCPARCRRAAAAAGSAARPPSG